MQANVVTSQQDRCGLFDFMANRMGVRVLHPGGYEATDRLLSKLNLRPESHVLDLACGVGTTSLRIAHKFGCRVTGIDIAPALIQQARDTAERDRRGTRVSFEVADARALPFGDASFDAVVAQAFFVLVDESERALAQICRVLKPGGRLGALELSWAQVPPEDAYNDLVANTCTQMIPRMKSFQEWEAFFSSTGLIPRETLARPMPSGMWQMARAEGFSNFLSVMRRMLADSDARKRMMRVQKTFAKHAAQIGYGLYWFEKPMPKSAPLGV
jgi:ubiquinone/menaquinone biosynthesis C-methylase UbiE